MTDNEIKKALEYCSYGSEFKCQDCPANDCSLSCGSKLAKQALDLINQQQAEIEKLTVNSNAYALGMKRLSEQLEIAKSEAIKEFAERLKATYEKHIVCSFNVMNNEIDNLVKEMTESVNYESSKTEGAVK